MKKGESKNIIIALLVVIIIILGGLVVLFATNTISFNSNEINVNNTQENGEFNENDLKDDREENNKVTSADIYGNFLNKKEYLNNFSEDEHGVVSGVSYTYYDLDNDGIEELIVYISDGYDFGTHLFYTYVENEIKFIDKIYHFGNLTYNKGDASIVYTITRPSAAYGYSYGFYKLNNNKFELLKSVGVSIENGNEKYFIDDKIISKDEYEKYFDNKINFDFKELNN